MSKDKETTIAVAMDPSAAPMPMRRPASDKQIAAIFGTVNLGMPCMCIVSADGHTAWALDLSQAILFRGFVDATINLLREQSGLPPTEDTH